MSTASPEVLVTSSRGYPSNSDEPCLFSLIPNDDDIVLVDQLLEQTKRLMTSVDNESNQNRLIDAGKVYHTIAFSGGVDSSLVAALVYRCSLDLNRSTSNNNVVTHIFSRHSVSCVMGVSAAVPTEQVTAAALIAQSIGISFQTVPTWEGRNETYIENNGRACFACKTELYGTLKAVADHIHAQRQSPLETTSDDGDRHTRQHHFLYNGTNADDLQDPTRLGLIAAANFQVRSPIAGLTKDQVRRAARHLGLANWNVAASPCLRSRLALGVPATTAHLQRIAQAERFVRQQLIQSLSNSTNLRVRLLAGQEARLELDAGPALDAAMVSFATNQQKWEQAFYDDLSFSKLTIAPFRSGSVSNRSLPLEEGLQTMKQESFQ
jgi:pyridinium-3,5-biscarboxylic acid mononucleotide sulfurtransferase